MQEGEEVRQKNEGKWPFSLHDSTNGSAVELDVEIGRYMDTSLVKADVQPFFVRLIIKVWACLRMSQATTCCFGLLTNIPHSTTLIERILEVPASKSFQPTV